MSESEKIMIKCYLVIFSLFITVSSAQNWSQNDYSNRNQADEWVWGYTVYTKPASKPNVPANPDGTHDKITDPCAPYDPPKPNFSGPGRRICDIKCYEYIWELNTRHERTVRSEECMKKWVNSNPNYTPPLSAIGGRITEPGEFPHMGAIGWQASAGKWVFKCGSSLISSKFVLTAGHCSRASDRDTTIADPVPKIVRLGDKNIIDVYTNGVLPTDAKIINIIVHPEYRPPKKYYDIALMELENHVGFNKYIQPACLWTRFNTSSLGTEATLTGWGVVETISAQLQFRSYIKNAAELNENDEWVWGYANPENRISEEWVWGYEVPEPTTVPAPTMNPTVTNDRIQELCSPYNPPKPKFSATGRRISERKCYEYIWELQTRHERQLRSQECSLALEKNTEFIVLGAVGGREADPGEFPHMGAVGWQASTGTWVFKCGSSLISSKFVLTAGHCSRASDRDTTIADPVPKIIRLGDKNIIDVYTNGVLPTDAKIINILVHPKYHPPKKYYDIALMELQDHVEFSKYVQPACLWTRFNTSSLGTEAILTGWGVVETIGRTTSPELQAAVVDFIDTTVCDKLLRPSCNRNWCGVRDNQICAGKLEGGVDACQGDSGGPLQVQIPLPVTTEGNMHYIVGVTSFGIGCALPNLPGIYSRVSMYLDWIESVVWPMLP